MVVVMVGIVIGMARNRGRKDKDSGRDLKCGGRK